MVRQLPPGFALVIRGGCSPVIARLPRVWDDPAYRRARRRGRAAAAVRPEPAAEPAGLAGRVAPVRAGGDAARPVPARNDLPVDLT